MMPSRYAACASHTARCQMHHRFCMLKSGLWNACMDAAVSRHVCDARCVVACRVCLEIFVWLALACLCFVISRFSMSCQTRVCVCCCCACSMHTTVELANTLHGRWQNGGQVPTRCCDAPPTPSHVCASMLMSRIHAVFSSLPPCVVSAREAVCTPHDAMMPMHAAHTHTADRLSLPSCPPS